MMDDYQTRIFNQDGYTVDTKKNALLLYEWILKKDQDAFMFNSMRRSGPYKLRSVDALSESIKPLLTSGLIKRLPEWSCIDGMFSKQSFVLEGNSKEYPVRTSTTWQAGRSSIGPRALSEENAITLKRIVSLIGSASHIARQSNVGIPTINKIKNNPKPGIYSPT